MQLFDAKANRPGDVLAAWRQHHLRRHVFRLGVDGVFSDNPDTAKAARDEE